MAPHEQLNSKMMSNTSTDKKLTEDGGAVGKPAVMPSAILSLAEAIEAKGAKVIFGLQPKDREVIEKHLAMFEGAEYSSQVWADIGKKINWCPLTAALWYFRERDGRI